MATPSPTPPLSPTSAPKMPHWYRRAWMWVQWQTAHRRRAVLIWGCMGLLIVCTFCCCSGDLFAVALDRLAPLPLVPVGSPTPYPTFPLLPTATSAPATPWPTPVLLPTSTPIIP